MSMPLTRQNTNHTRRAPHNWLIAATVGLFLGITLIASGRSVVAADIGIEAFRGHFVGAGISRTEASDYFGLTVRDFDITIVPAGDGFSISWTTVLREGGTPNEPNIRRKSASLSFVPSRRAGIWHASDAKDPLAGGPAAWAYIEETSLMVHSLTIADDGNYAVQTYRRKLTDLGMELTFVSVRSGETTRMVEGRLTKSSN